MIIGSVVRSYYHCRILRRNFQNKIEQKISFPSYATSDIIEEIFVIDSKADSDQFNIAESFKDIRPEIEITKLELGFKNEPSILWSTRRNNIQIDSTELAEVYIGKRKLSYEENFKLWTETVTNRIEILEKLKNKDSYLKGNKFLGDGGSLQYELDSAIAIVQRASFVSRSLQRILLSDQSSKVDKVDKSPVTIADFAVQAIILSFLHECFPSDKFIAEEDSEILRRDASVRQKVLDTVFAALGERWSDEQLFQAVDLGSFDGSGPALEAEQRVWVLDPVDGTKGFMRNQHYCVALGLLVHGSAKLSVMGCPNLNAFRVLEGKSYDNKDIGFLDRLQIPVKEGDGLGLGLGSDLPAAESGSLYFAVSGQGAFVRSLSMPLGAAFEVRVSGKREVRAATLCESYEASHGNREVSSKVFELLNLQSDYVRLDGQCKYCVIGAGAADGNLRLPADGYKEKIWDQAPGAHFLLEAGGQITDLKGGQLDFRQGRVLNVTGIVASNGLLHQEILSAVQEAKESLK